MSATNVNPEQGAGMSRDETPEFEIDVDGLRQGRADAIEAWFGMFSDPLYTFIYYRVGKDRQRAADITQETFLTALRTIRRYDPARGEMFPWLTYIARNAVRKAMRHARRYASAESLWDTIDQRILTGLQDLERAPLPDELLDRQETAELVRLALSQIPPHYQRSLEDHYFHDRTVRESAEAHGTSTAAAKVRLHRARLAFKAAFETVVNALASGRSLRSVNP